jgi:chromosome partitioning protein
LQAVVNHIRDRDMVFLDTPLFEKEAFRALFAVGGGWDAVAASGVGGVPAARQNAQAYVEAVVECVAQDGK